MDGLRGIETVQLGERGRSKVNCGRAWVEVKGPKRQKVNGLKNENGRQGIKVVGANRLNGDGPGKCAAGQEGIKVDVLKQFVDIPKRVKEDGPEKVWTKS